jgi:hypothetical protein
MTLKNMFAEPIEVTPSNITGKFRESFENFTPGVNWNLTTGSGDIVQLDGNAVSASYLVISKDPLTVGTETSLTYTGSFPMPIELAVGLSMSQRTLGQELSMELVSTEEAIPAAGNLPMSVVGQNGATLYVVTSVPHGLLPGRRVGITGVTSDSRMNYPSLVVSFVVSPTEFYCAAGPAGNIPNLTVGPYNNQGQVYIRSAIGGAQNGLSQVFENNSATNSSTYVRAAAGDVLPTGTMSGNHSIGVGSTSPNQAISSPYTYSFLPTNEFRFSLQADRLIQYDAVIDTTSSQSTRMLRTQVVPDATKDYTLRFRVSNNQSLPVPNAKIISAVKSASATATITTAAAHGLTTNDFVTIYGVGDTTNFPNVTTSARIASTPTSTTFTVVIGSSATATSAGGFVSRSQGSQAIQGVSPIQAQICTVTATDLRLQGIGTWSGFSIGDYVNVYGVRNRANGNDLGVDGVYKVVNSQTSIVTLEPLAGTVLPAPMTNVSCGGAVIKRTDVRISFVRVFNYARERVELLAQPSQAAATPVFMTGGTLGSGSVLGFTPPNTIVTDVGSAAITSTQTSSTITPTASGSSEFNLGVTAVSGTGPTLDVVVQESDDTGNNWYDIYHFPRITATGQYRSPLIPMTGNRVRYVRTVGGTSPSFTMTVNRLVVNTPQPLQRQFLSRIDLNTLNNVTASFFMEGCADLNIVVSMLGVTTTAPVLVYETSVEATGTAWAQVGADITATANSTTLLQLSNVQSRFSRIRVKTAGSGATVNYIMVKGVGR